MRIKPQPEPWYQMIVQRHTPPRRVWCNCLCAFIGGGLLCSLAQSALFVLMEFGRLTRQEAAPLVLLGVILLTALLTGLGIYDRLGQKAGAGLAVPISGFANSVAASMMEHQSEGLVLGSGCNSFKLAGAVIVFGIVSAFSVTALKGLIRLLLG